MSNDPHLPPSDTPTYVPWTGPKGWGNAAFIVILALVLVFTAYTIHKRTFKPFRDPTNVDGDRPTPAMVTQPASQP
jgi:hypothetical protein